MEMKPACGGPRFPLRSNYCGGRAVGAGLDPARAGVPPGILRGLLILCVWAQTLLPAPSAASGEQATGVTLNEVVVTGRRVKDQTAQSTLILTEKYAERTVSLPEVLQSVAGVKINRFGGLGSFATISIRGSTSEQVQIYLDGVPLNTIQGGGLDLSTIPLDLIESVEVFRGQTPAEFGQAGIGGIVDIHTRRPDGAFLTRLKSGGGSFGTWTGSTVHSGHGAGLRYLLGGNVERTRGNFSYLDDNGTPFNRDDDARVTRANNNSQAWGGIGQAEYELSPAHELQASLHANIKAQGVPGIGSFHSREAQLETSRQSAALAWKRKQLTDEAVGARVSAFLAAQQQAFRDLQGEIGVASQDNRNRTLGWGMNGITTLPIGARQRWTGFLELRREEFSPRDALFPNPLTAGRRDTAVGVIQNEILLPGGRFLVAPSGRLEYALSRAWLVDPQTSSRVSASESRARVNPTGRLGARYSISDSLTASANVGTVFRNPDFTELYGDRGFILGNPDLKPESGLNSDAGILQEWRGAGYLDSILVGIVAFASEVTNLIQFVQNSQQAAVAENFNRVRVLGAEAQLDLAAFRHAEFSTTYTYQRATDISPAASRKGRTVPGRPFNELTTRSGLLIGWAKLFYEFEFTEGNFLDRANFLLVPARSIHNAGLTLTCLKRYSATAEVKNFTANQLVDYNGYPLPGRSFFGSLSATF